jgi:hypothetical protein
MPPPSTPRTLTKSVSVRNATIIGALILAACAPVREAPPAPIAPPVTVAIAPGHYLIGPGDGAITVRVRRAGPLAALGHNHVITSGSVTGAVDVADDAASSRAVVRLDVVDLVVDDPDARAAAGAGFESAPSAADVAGTRANLLGPRVLDADHHPTIAATITLVRLEGNRADLSVTARLAGQEGTFPVSAVLEVTDGGFEVAASLSVDHATLGLTPFSVMGGALRVAEAIEVDVRLLARVPQGEVTLRPRSTRTGPGSGLFAADG